MPPTPDPQQTLELLTALANDRFGDLSPAALAHHIVAHTPGADWPVRKAAMEALLRRWRFAERDGLRVASRPRPGPLGDYTTTRTTHTPRDNKKRPYTTRIIALDPITTSCSCADFLRSSLGLCKHGLGVLASLSSRARATTTPAPPAPLTWDPISPLVGADDRLARLQWRGSKPIPGFVDGRPDPKLLASASTRLALIDAVRRRCKRLTSAPDPAALAVLEQERARATRSLEIRERATARTKGLQTLGRKLYPYQREAFDRFFTTGRLLLADDMGLGKTTQAIAICDALVSARRVRRGLLVVPAALKGQWKREWDATTDVPLVVVDGSPTERARIYADSDDGFLVIGYEQLLRDLSHVQRYGAEVVVLDEAQRIKNWATKSAAYVKSLTPRYRLVLTGTPMENRFDDLASIMDFVDDLALEPKWRLVPWHSTTDGDGGRGVTGARNLDALRARLAPVMLRRTRGEVLDQLPSRTDTRVPTELTPQQREEHDALIHPIAVLAAKMHRRPLTPPEFQRLMSLLATQRMACNGVAQLRFASLWPSLQHTVPSPAAIDELFAPKLSALRTIVEQVVIGQGRKAVVFSQWRAMLRLAQWAVRDLLAAAGMRAVFFTGAESTAVREKSIVQLHDEPTVTMMFLSDAGGVGLNLQRAATCCINLELPWNPAVLEQRIGRIHRIGQSHPIDVYNLVCEEGIESRIAELVANKRAVFSSLFDGTTDAVRFDGSTSFLEGVRRLVDPPDVPEAGNDGDEDTAEIAETHADDAVADDDARADDAPSLARAPTQPPAGLAIERLDDGRLRIEAPAELAEPLAALLEQLAASLRSANHAVDERSRE
jgi:superfamily II DNA or RNA helicase